jgi:hypothetical protein
VMPMRSAVARNMSCGDEARCDGVGVTLNVRTVPDRECLREALQAAALSLAEQPVCRRLAAEGGGALTLTTRVSTSP